MRGKEDEHTEFIVILSSTKGLLKYMQCPYYEVRVRLGQEDQCRKGVGMHVELSMLHRTYRKIVKKKKLKKGCLARWQERAAAVRQWLL